MERLDLYMRTGYSYKSVKKEFGRLCKRLKNVPENTPFCCNSQYYGEIEEILSSAEKYSSESSTALIDLEHLFEPMGAAV